MSDELPVRIPVGLTTEGLLGRRYAARCIDSMIVLILIFVIVLILAALGAVPKKGDGAWDVLLRLFAVPILWIGYGTVLESSPWQATFGKRWMGLRVYNAHGRRLTRLQAAGRNLLKDGPFAVLAVIPSGQILAMIWLGAHIIVLHRSSVYQAIHDRVANTWVAAPEQTIRLHLA